MFSPSVRFPSTLRSVAEAEALDVPIPSPGSRSDSLVRTEYPEYCLLTQSEARLNLFRVSPSYRGRKSPEASYRMPTSSKAWVISWPKEGEKIFLLLYLHVQVCVNTHCSRNKSKNDYCGEYKMLNPLFDNLKRFTPTAN